MTIPIRPSEASLIEVRQALQHIEMNRRTGVQDDFEATRDPVETDDETQGWSARSFWLYAALDRFWICTDATRNAAVWVNFFGPGVIAGSGPSFTVVEPPDANTLTASVKGDTLYVTATGGGITITGDGDTTLDFDVPKHEVHYTLLAAGAALVF